MDSNQKIDIEELVLNAMERELAIPRKQFKYSDDFVRDLRIDSDDLTMFALHLQKRLGITIPSEEWSNVYSVDTTINLLERYYTNK